MRVVRAPLSAVGERTATPFAGSGRRRRSQVALGADVFLGPGARVFGPALGVRALPRTSRGPQGLRVSRSGRLGPIPSAPLTLLCPVSCAQQVDNRLTLAAIIEFLSGFS